MELKEAINRVKEEFGADYLLNKNIVSVLADYGAYKNERAYRIIIKLLIAEKTIEKYLKGIGETERNKIVNDFTINTGISEVKAYEVLEIFRSVFCEDQEKSTICIERKIESKNRGVSGHPEEVHLKRSKFSEISFSAVSLLGVPFGSEYANFRKAIEAKGGSVCMYDKSGLRFLLHNFLYGNRNLITIGIYKFCNIVKRISIQQSISDEITRKDRLRKIRELYLSKYGIPKVDGTWYVDNVRITVMEEKFQYADKIKIEYLYLHSALVEYENKEEERLLEEKRRVAEMKRIEEERIKKEKELIEKKKEEAERKALWNDI